MAPRASELRSSCSTLILTPQVDCRCFRKRQRTRALARMPGIQVRGANVCAGGRCANSGLLEKEIKTGKSRRVMPSGRRRKIATAVDPPRSTFSVSTWKACSCSARRPRRGSAKATQQTKLREWCRRAGQRSRMKVLMQDMVFSGSQGAAGPT